MRVATIGLDLPGTPRLRFRGDDTLAAYDAVIWDPNALFDEFAGQLEQRRPRRVLSVQGSEALLADLRRRRANIAALLERGGALVVHPPRDETTGVHTLETIIEIEPAASLPIAGMRTIAGAQGPLRCDSGEPFASFFAATSDLLAPERVFEPTIGEPLFPDASGRPTGLYIGRQRGHLLFLPPPRRADPVYVDALLRMLSRLMIDVGVSVPAWTQSYVLPGEAELRDALERNEAERRRLDQAIAQTRAQLYAFDRRKQLITGQGRALYDAATQAFWDLGCTVYQGPHGDTDFIIERGARTALVHAVARFGPILAEDVTQLAAWARADAARLRQSIKPVLLAVPYRDLPLAQRPAPVIAPEIGAQAQTNGVAILTGIDLLALSISNDTDASLDALFTNSGALRLNLSSALSER